MKNQLVTRILCLTLACSILSSDIGVYAASDFGTETEATADETLEEESFDEPVTDDPEEADLMEGENVPDSAPEVLPEDEVTEEEDPVTEEPAEKTPEEVPEKVYEPYWEDATLSDLILFVAFADTDEEHQFDTDTLEVFWGEQSEENGMREEISEISNEEIRIETLIPQYEEEAGEVLFLTLENEAAYYIENEEALIEEAAEAFEQSELFIDGMVLDYGNEEDLLDHLTIVALQEAAESGQAFESHTGIYEGNAGIEEKTISSYSIVTEKDLCDEENALELIVANMQEVLARKGLLELPEEEEEAQEEETELAGEEDGQETQNPEEEPVNAQDEIKTGIQTVGKWSYLYDENGMLMKGYASYGENTYYCDQNGILQSGWIKVGTVWRYFDAEVGFAEITCETADGYFYVLSNGNVSYFTNKTTLLKNSWLNYGGNRYYFDEKGLAVQGWHQDGNYTYYAQTAKEASKPSLTGAMVKGIREIDGAVYGFHSTGYYCLGGWQTIGGQRYYFRDDYSAVTGWYKEGNYWYYARQDGTMVKGEVTIDDQTYYFDANYRQAAGWIKLNNEWRYFQKGTSKEECYELKFTRQSDGWMFVDGQRKCYVNKSNVLLKGWQTIDGQRYYFNADYMLETGWFTVGNYTYYAQPATVTENDGTIPQGAVAKGVKVIEGKTYIFHTTSYYTLTGWQTVNGKRYYLKADGSALNSEWYQEGDYWYHAGADGAMAYGYTQIDGKYYYFDNNYRLGIGWKRIDNVMHFFDAEAENPEKCCELTVKGNPGGWFTISDGDKTIGKSYIKTNYQVLTGWQTIDGKRYYFDADGIMGTGWFQVGRYYYYADPESGMIASGVQKIGEKIYGFHQTQYYALTGWQTLGGQRYYFQDDRTAVTGWYQEGNYWYYADADGCMAKGKCVQIGDKTCYFDANYRLATGWIKVGTDWRYFNADSEHENCYEITYSENNGWLSLSNGKKAYLHTKNGILKSWQTIDGQRYYFGTDGILVTGKFEVGNYTYYAEPEVKNGETQEVPMGALAKGIKTIDGETYVFHTSSYYRLTGWQTVNGSRFYLGTDGKAQSGLFEVSGRKYYGEEWGTVKGALVTGAVTVDGVRYVFHPSQYYLLTGWQTVNGKRYYLGTDGKALTDTWYQEGDYWYHAGADGAMAYGRTLIGDRYYYFDNNYRLSTGWKRIGNKMHFFDAVAENPSECYELIDVSAEALGSWVMLCKAGCKDRKSYIKTNYQVVTGWQTIDGKRYYFDADGIMETGWFQLGRYYYYADPESGIIASGVQTIDGSLYGFHPTQYYALMGWQTIDGQRYYFQDDSHAVIGWYREGNYWYYADADGCMAKGKCVQIGDKTCYFDANYRLATGWIKVGTDWRYFQTADDPMDCYEIKPEGGADSGWITLENGTKAYLHAKNGILKNWQTIDGQRYYFGTDGILRDGWFEVGGYWYYAENGQVQKGAYTVSGEGADKKTYYFDGNYRLATGWIRVGTDWKYFNADSDHENCYEITYSENNGWLSLSNGKKAYLHTKNGILKSWQTINGQRYYFGTDGILVTGEFQVGSYSYYADANGAAAKGVTRIGDKLYGYHPTGYYRLSGWQTIDGKRYYFGEDFAAVTGWCQLGDYWYYADQDGVMAIGYAENISGENYYFDNNYRLSTGWKRISNEMHYFDFVAETPEKCCELTVEGKLGGWFTISNDSKTVGKSYIKTNYQVLTGWQTIDGKRYYFDADGIMQTGWFQVGRYYYYADPVSGTIASGVQTIGEKIYGFHQTQYYALTGWQTLGGQRYYFQDDWTAVTGWYKEGNYWYYAKPEDGSMARAECVKINEDTYYFDANYRLATGWIRVGTDWRYFNSDPDYEKCYEIKYSQTDGWLNLTNGKRACLHAKNGILKSWQTIDGQRYYFGTDGMLVTGEFKVGNYTYYAEPEVKNGETQEVPVGALAKGIKTIDGETYVFHTSSYYRLTGWQTVSGSRFYLGTDGKAQSGLFEVSGRKYYGEPSGALKGALVTGAVTVDGVRYVFHPSQYYMLTGWQTVNGKRYYLGTDGKALTDTWYQEGDYWYHADADGAMAYGRTLIGDRYYYFDNNYRLSTGWKRIGNEMHFFDAAAENPAECYELVTVSAGNLGSWVTITKKGCKERKSYIKTNYQVLTGWQTISGERYYFDANGIVVTGEFQSGRYYYYAKEDGSLAKNTQTIGGKLYGYHPTGYYRLTGWQTLHGERYYFQNDGTAVNGWYQEGSYRYYAGTDGKMVKGDQTIDQITYHFDNNYRLKTGWQTMNGKRCYLDEDGVLAIGWFEAGGYWYYAESDGGVVKGQQTLRCTSTGKEEVYYFDNNYRLQTGWITLNGQRCYFDNADKPQDSYQIYKGAVSKGWFTFEGKTCYFNNSLNPLTGWQTISSVRYYFGTKGVMETGWFEIGGYWYYAKADGAVVNGTQKLKAGETTKTYYFDENYRLQTGWQTLNGKTCYVTVGETPADYQITEAGNIPAGWFEVDGKTFYGDNYGKVKTGWQTIEKQRYYFDAAGVRQTGWFTLSGKTYYADPVTGIAASGVQEIDGSTYVFHASQYYMLTGFQSYGGKRYYLQSDGTAKTGWFSVGIDRYYGNEDGSLAVGAQNIDGETYFFHTSAYYRVTGWQTANGNRYYLNIGGTAQTGWFTVSNKIYYAEPNTANGILQGTLARGAKTVEGKTYVFHTSAYYRLTGWQTVNGNRYYLNADGTAQTEWFTVSGKTYYAGANGIVAKGLTPVTEKNTMKMYYFHPGQFYLLTGFQTISGQRYYFDTDGVMETGWFENSGYNYYADADGKLVKGLQELAYRDTEEKKTYYFDNNYRQKTGWITIGIQRYFFENAERPENCYQTQSGKDIKAGWFTLASGKTCYADANGNVKTGWQTISGQRYYFDANGVLQTGWFTVSGKTYYADADGIVSKGAVTIGTETYVFHVSQYYMLTGWQTVNGNRYYLDAEGKAVRGWQTISGRTYYADPATGVIARGAVEIEGKMYVFHSSAYYMLTGFQSYGGKRYYLQSDGTAKTGWFTVGVDRYYGNADGTLAAGAQNIDGETYFFHTSACYRVTGWQTANGNRYYLKADGTAQTGWFTVSNKIYYAEPQTDNGILRGTLAKGAKTIDEKTYVFHTSSYYRLTGWQTVNGNRYYLNTDGTAKTGWFTVSGKMYYADEEGIVSKGAVTIGTETYVFHVSQYYMLTGWQTVNGQRYYLNANGTAFKGWFTVSGKTYYADADGIVSKGAVTIEGKTYVFHSSQYYMLTGFQSYGGKRYYLQSDGTARKGWFSIGVDRYYGNADGTLAVGAQEIEGKTYFFHISAYYRLTGWQTVNGNRYYLNADGTAKTGWFTVSNKIYYAEPQTDNGILQGTLAKGAKTVEGKTYVFHTSSCYRLTGWQTVNGNRYYLNTDGTAQTGWFTVSGKTYYADSGTGIVAKGLTPVTEENGENSVTKTYYFHPSQYYKLTGWQTISGQRYYFDANGIMETGWFENGGYNYYAGADGKLVKGLQELAYKNTEEKKTYYFDNNYRLKTGWITISNQRYFFENANTPEECYATVSSYELTTGWITLNNGQICYVNTKGTAVTGWQTISGQRYYFDANGVLQTGWFTVSGKTYYADENGIVAKGAVTIKGETYVFHTSAYYRLTGWQTVNGNRYYLDADGKAVKDWQTISGRTYYADPATGIIAKGAVEIAGKTYVFHSSQYYMLTGFQSYGGKRYYLQSDGTAKTGWFTVGVDRYYGNADGTLAVGAQEIEGKTYFFHTSAYYRVTGWQTVNGNRYYLNADGTAKTGWFTVSNKIYYAEPQTDNGILQGTLAKGAKTVEGKTYVFHTSSYYRLTGWQTVNGKRYYLNTDGTAQTGWFTVSGKMYYADANGIVAKGLTSITENDTTKTYYFHPSQFYLLTGFQTIGGQRYYFDTDGVMETGWFENSGYQYHAGADGKLAKGLVNLPYGTGGEEKTYYFDNNYRQKTGWQTLNSKKYFFMTNADPAECYAAYIGSVSLGWMTMSDGNLYYADSRGNIKSGWQTIGGQRYYFETTGALKTGWFTVGNYRYYAQPQEEESKEQTIPAGVAAKGAKEIDGETYFFHLTGYYRVTGWQTEGTKRYYIQSTGKAKTGWFKQGSYWYYGLEETADAQHLKGSMEQGLCTISVMVGEQEVERTYYFDTNYRLASGWKIVNGVRYFFAMADDPRDCYLIAEEPVTSGWYTFGDGTKSYFNAQGNPVTGWQTIEGRKYYFDVNGIMQTGWVILNGVSYYFDNNGIYIPMTTPVITAVTSTAYETIDIQWNAVAGVQNYILEYSKDSVFPSWKTASVRLDSSVKSYRLEEMEADTTYYFRLHYTVWSGDAENADLYESPYSAVKSVKVRGEVAATSTSATISDCRIVEDTGTRDKGMTVHLKASLKDRIRSADDYYYIVETESYGSTIDLAEPVKAVEKAFDIDTDIEITAGVGGETAAEATARAVMNKFALAVKTTSGSYQVISTPVGIRNPEEIAEYKKLPKATSKKGIQGVLKAQGHYTPTLNADDANTKQTLINVYLDERVSNSKKSGFEAYTYKGKTYYFSDFADLKEEVKNLNAGYDQYINGKKTDENGEAITNEVIVTLCLLLRYNSANSYLIDPAARTPGHTYYTFNVREEKVRETYEALFCYMGEKFSKRTCHVVNWVLGNEINSSRAWQYQGSLSFDSYMQVYTSAFRLLYNGIRRSSEKANVYISLDNGWTAAPDTYAGKTVLDCFAALAQKENPEMSWSIAYHPYSYPLTRCDFWNDYTYTTNSLSTGYISMRNIEVLTNYAASLEQSYGKESGSIRVILSEQGYTSSSGEALQAEALVRAYYKAEFNDRIDAFIIRATMDDTSEMAGGLYLGLYYQGQAKKISFYVYEYMDSDINVFYNKDAGTIAAGANISKVRNAQAITKKIFDTLSSVQKEKLQNMH